MIASRLTLAVALLFGMFNRPKADKYGFVYERMGGQWTHGPVARGGKRKAHKQVQRAALKARNRRA